MKGRKPTPTHLKVIRGNPGRRPLNEGEPQPHGDGEKPAFLEGRASRLWDEYAPELRRIGLLTSIDAPMFAAWCSLMEQFEERNGRIDPSKISQMRGLAASFGLEPSSRSRISLKDDGKDDSPAAKYFAS